MQGGADRAGRLTISRPALFIETQRRSRPSPALAALRKRSVRHFVPPTARPRNPDRIGPSRSVARKTHLDDSRCSVPTGTQTDVDRGIRRTPAPHPRWEARQHEKEHAGGIGSSLRRASSVSSEMMGRERRAESNSSARGGWRRHPNDARGPLTSRQRQFPSRQPPARAAGRASIAVPAVSARRQRAGAHPPSRSRAPSTRATR